MLVGKVGEELRGSASCRRWPASISSSRAFSFFLLLVARFLKPLSSSSRAIRSGVAWKFSRSGRSTVILWKPKSALSKTLLTTRWRSTGCLVIGSSSVKVRVSPSWKLPKMRVMSPIWSGSLARRPGRRCLLRLLPRLFFILTKKLARVDELDLALAPGLLAVGEHPDVGGDAGVVEELVGQRDDGFQPVVLDDPLADVALAAAGVAGEERRAVEDDADAAAAILGSAHLREHVLQKEERAVVDARQSRAEAAVVAECLRARSRCSSAAASTPRRRADWPACSRRCVSCRRRRGRSRPCVKVSPSMMLSASSPLMSMSDLQTAQASSFQSWPKRCGLASAFRSRMYFSATDSMPPVPQAGS